ncbi:MAG: hypothetical protein AAF799_28880 [Myxococcota bacterium]
MLIALHVASLVVLSLPTPSTVHNKARWKTANAQADLEQMAKRLRGWGIDTDRERLTQSLWDLGGAYLKVQRPLVAPFHWYSKHSGSRQGWRMFASPQRHPAELHVDIELDGVWVPIYQPHSDEYDWNRAQFEHNRFRKFLGRFARGFVRTHYDHATRWIATKAAREHPEATRVRIQLYRYATPGPEQVKAGIQPKGRYQHPRRFDAEALR